MFLSEKRATRSSGEHLIPIVDDDYYARGGLSAFIESLSHTSFAFASENYFSSDVAFRNAYPDLRCLSAGSAGSRLADPLDR